MRLPADTDALGVPADDRGAARALWRLGAPIATQAIVSSLLGFLDTLMVSALGAAALGGVGLGGRLLFVLTMMLVGISSGVGVLVAQFAGAGRRRAIRGPVTAAALLGIVITLPFAALCALAPHMLADWMTPDMDVAQHAARFLQWGALYAPLTAVALVLGATVRSLGDARTPLVAGLVALAINALLNFLFISGRFGLPAYGVAAAAVATTLARVVEIAWLLVVLRPGALRPSRRRDARLVLGIALPLMAKEIFWAGGLFATALIVSRMGTVPLAAFNLVAPIEGVLMSVFVGCGAACGILLGHALGRRAFDDAYAAALRLLRLVPRWAFVTGLVVAVLAQAAKALPMPGDWLPDEVLTLALDTLTVFCLTIAARTHNTMVSIGILRSGNDVAWLMAVDFASMWLVNIPLVAIAALVLQWPLPAVVGVAMLEEVFKVALFRWRVRGGKWLKAISPAG